MRSSPGIAGFKGHKVIHAGNYLSRRLFFLITWLDPTTRVVLQQWPSLRDAKTFLWDFDVRIESALRAGPTKPEYLTSWEATTYVGSLTSQRRTQHPTQTLASSPPKLN